MTDTFCFSKTEGKGWISSRDKAWVPQIIEINNCCSLKGWEFFFCFPNSASICMTRRGGEKKQRWLFPVYYKPDWLSSELRVPSCYRAVSSCLSSGDFRSPGVPGELTHPTFLLTNTGISSDDSHHQSGTLSLVQTTPDTVLWLVDPYYTSTKVYAITIIWHAPLPIGSLMP